MSLDRFAMKVFGLFLKWFIISTSPSFCISVLRICCRFFLGGWGWDHEDPLFVKLGKTGF